MIKQNKRLFSQWFCYFFHRKHHKRLRWSVNCEESDGFWREAFECRKCGRTMVVEQV